MSISTLKYETYQGVKHQNDQTKAVDDTLCVEMPLQIKINGKDFSMTMRTPGDDTELIKGLLFTEDLIKAKDLRDLSIPLNIKNEITIADLSIDPSLVNEPYLNSRSLLSTTSCGICGKTNLDQIRPEGEIVNTASFSVQQIHAFYHEMRAAQQNFEQSGGSHAAATFSATGSLLSIKEDIGRHNAVDKIIGELIEKEQLKEAVILLLSGRISYELVSKAFKAGIGVIVAISAPSSLAVDMAKELGITLVGFCREERLTVYSHPEKIK